MEKQFGFNWQGNKSAIEENYEIINKEGKRVKFILNKAQDHFIQNLAQYNIVLKDRQLGFSAEILALGTNKFIFGENQRCVSMSHEASATQRLLDRVKFFKDSFERNNNVKIPLKYNSRNELVYGERNNTFYIGTAGSSEFGRGDTITFLHLSEFAFYPDPEKILAGIMQAVVPDGIVFIETTANGFNFFKTVWDEAVMGVRNFKPHFYGPEWEYSKEFLGEKKKQLGRLFVQEYPNTPEEAFLTSGDLYFNSDSLKWYLDRVQDPIKESVIYV
jgi:hypothetical protein